MADKSSNVPSSTFYSAIGAESLIITRKSNNPEAFSVKPPITRMIRQRVSIEKINKHQGDFINICQSKQELLHLVS